VPRSFGFARLRKIVFGSAALFLAACIIYVLWPRIDAAWSAGLACEKPVFEFGEAATGESLVHSFEIRNTGFRTVTITGVRADCGCIVANTPKQPLARGESVTITATVGLKNLRGKLRKSILVESDDPKNTHLQLIIQGMVTSNLRIRPSLVNFGKISTDSSATETVEIAMLDSEQPLRITKAVSSNSNRLLVRSEQLEFDKGHRLHVTLKGPLALGRINESIRLYLDNPSESQAVIPVTALVVGDVVVEPDKISLVVNHDKPVGWWLAVTPGKIKEFTIKGIDVPLSTIGSEIIPIDGKQGFRIRLSNILATEELNGKYLCIRTDVKGMEAIHIPFQIVNKTKALR
jgi:hypothetical protein